MNDARPLSRNFAGFAVTAAAVLAALPALSGCGSKDTWAKVNGQVVTRDEYVHMLERQTVVVPGGQPTNAERLVLDTLIGNKVILAEAAKNNVLPSDEEVNRYYELQKNLFEQQVPGKKYEDTMKEQGTTPEEVKADMRVQLAETNLYAKQLKLGDDQVRKAYESVKQQVGLPPRVQLRVIVVIPNSPDFQKAKQALASPNANFDAVAKQINLTPALKASSGLQPQAIPVRNISAAFQSQVDKTKEGKWFGPVDYSLGGNQPNMPPMKAWVKIEKKLPAYSVSQEDAAPLIRRQLVQMQIMQPNNAGVRAGIMGEKLKANFEPTDAAYKSVWDGVKKAAEDAGLGQPPAAAAANPMNAPAALGAGGVTTPPGPATTTK